MTTATASPMIAKRDGVALEPLRVTARVSAYICYRAQLGRGWRLLSRYTPALFLAIALPADAADKRVWGGYTQSVVAIGPPTASHATATVTFKNTTVHSRSETFALDWEGIEIGVQFEWQADGNAERITVTPPDGYMAQPESVTVAEGETGKIQIVKFEGM